MAIDIDLVEIAGSCLLFLLVFGMSATVDTGCMIAQLRNRKAILAGVFLQFAIMPALGWLVVRTLKLNAPLGITLLVVTSSPGGSYSNWWCSMFNADLALSVAMTAISTLLSSFMLPLNLIFYSKLSFGGDILGALDWPGLFIAIGVVLSAIGLGIYCSEKNHSHYFNIYANMLGNFAGIALVIFSAFVSNSESDSKVWERDWEFYAGVASPCVIGLIVANILTTLLDLLKPERITVSVECSYQNVGIATSVAISMFDGTDLAEAMGVPFFYGLVEASVLGLYCLGAWKAGWTKAPADVPFCEAIGTSYEVISAEKAEHEALKLSENQDESDGFHFIEFGESATPQKAHSDAKITLSSEEMVLQDASVRSSSLSTLDPKSQGPVYEHSMSMSRPSLATTVGDKRGSMIRRHPYLQSRLKEPSFAELSIKVDDG